MNPNEKAEQLAKTENRNYINTTVTVLWAFATVITAAAALNAGGILPSVAAVVSLAGAIYMTVRAYKKNK